MRVPWRYRQNIISKDALVDLCMWVFVVVVLGGALFPGRQLALRRALRTANR